MTPKKRSPKNITWRGGSNSNNVATVLHRMVRLGAITLAMLSVVWLVLISNNVASKERQQATTGPSQLPQPPLRISLKETKPKEDKVKKRGGVKKNNKIPPPKSTWKRNEVTLSNYEIAGVNLALYKLGATGQEKEETTAKPFELYEDFDIGDMLKGDETWNDLVKDIRRHLERPSLSFYVDKVAQKRWLPTRNVAIPQIIAANYRSELTTTGKHDDEQKALLKLLPNTKGADFAAKPTHTSYSDGVFLVKNVVTKKGEIKTYVSTQGKDYEKDKIDREYIAHSLAKTLDDSARDDESWALKNVKPGVVIEERFASLTNDDRPAMEFKVFCIWGKAWVASWKQNYHRYALINRDGQVLQGKDNQEGATSLPDWIDHSKVVEVAEKLAAHKDFLRVDIFVGVPGSAPALKKGAAKAEQKAAVKVVVSESEVFPTSSFKDKRIFEEGARLWVAGYKIGNYRVVPNPEVPEEYKRTGQLSLAAVQ